MNFDRIQEHEMLRDSVRAFFDRELPEPRIREMDRARRVPRERFAFSAGSVRHSTRMASASSANEV